MRQAGILAAAGIVALETMVERLKQDHAHARQLAGFLETLSGIELENNQPPTNMLFFRLTENSTVGSDELVERMKARDVILSGSRGGRYRLVLHAGIDDEDLEVVQSVFREILGSA